VKNQYFVFIHYSVWTLLASIYQIDCADVPEAHGLDSTVLLGSFDILSMSFVKS